MIVPLLLTLQVASPPMGAGGDSAVVVLEAPTEVREGDTLAVRVATADYGYLVVFHIDPGGRIGLLHPRGTAGEQAVRGRRVYRLTPPAGDRAFVVEAGRGSGAVVAAFARTQFRLGLLAHSGGWDRGWIGQVPPGEGAEEYLRRLVGDLARTSDVRLVSVRYRVRESGSSGDPGAN